ncbi:sensor domain-containing diguanylate cyclase [Ruminococcus flavefaciens]|uniref:sensor domain-containing diguanylate cyclase n=1 Tax=Ruminococcus flavefaciens TaxID=1265 RepID=UPI00048F05AB|nr:GGDEF domain-containing protein [Ruminococcus flavefaciens]
MNYQEIVDGFVLTTCILSIEKLPDGGYGNIRIVAGNKPYIDSIENPANGASAHMLNNKFIPDSPYEKYIPKDLNFEQAVYKSAILKTPIHTYLKPERFFCWLNQYILPIESDDPNKGYCSYSMQITMEANSEMMSNVSASASSAVLETCIKLRGSTDFKKTLHEIICDICELCGANRCSLLQTDFKAKSCSLLAKVVIDKSKDTAVVSEETKPDFELVSTWNETIAGSNCLILENEKDMEVLRERNPRWYDSLKAANLQSLVLFPLNYNNETLGYIWAVNFNTENTLRIKETLSLTTYFIASELSNYQLLNRLEVMSSVDLLTGIYNRNAMNNRIDRYISGAEPTPENYGIVFADLNGLKQVNDSGGHIAGDKLLKNAAAVLRELFYDSDIYRAGGDEYMIIAVNVPEEELEKRMEKLRKDSEDTNNISFAVGGYYEANGGDIRYAMRTADERMYADKDRYYRKFPERKRK